MAAAETARLIASLELQDKLSPGVARASASLSRLEKAAGSGQGSLGKLARGMQGLDKATGNTQRSLGKFSQNIQRGLVIGAAAVTTSITAVVKSAADFEASLNTINSVAQVGPTELNKIGVAIRNVAKDTGTSLTDLTQGYYDLVSAGIKTADASNVLTQANKLAIGGIGTTTEAIDLLTTAINSYGGDATKAAEYTNAFAEAVGAGKTTISQIAESFAQVGPLAATAGISINEIAAALGVMTAKGTPTAEAITQIRSAIVALEKPNASLLKIIKATGTDFAALARDKGLAFAYNELGKAAEKACIPMVKLTGRVEGALFAAQVTGPEYAAYAAELNKVEHASDGAGVAQAQMAERMKGLTPQINRLRQTILDAAITIGTKLLPKITPLIERLSAFLQANQGKIEAFGDSLATGFEKFATALGKVDWTPFIDGLRLSADIAKTAIGIFRSLPEGLQAGLVAGFAVNKITGGLPTSIVKDAGGILLDRLAKRGSSPANALWVQQVGGLGGAAGGAPVVGGAKLGSVAAAVGKVFLIGAAVGVFAELTNVLGDQTKANQQQAAGLNEQTSLYVKSASIDQMKASLAALKDTSGYSLAEQLALNLNIDGVRDAIIAQQAQLEQAIAKAEAAAANGTTVAVRALTSAITAGGFDSRITTRGAKADGGKDDQVDLRPAIRAVERKIVGREFVQRQLVKADQLLKSNQTNGQKIKALESIQRALGNRSVAATNAVRAKLESVRTAARDAGRHSANAIKNKKLSTTVNVRVNNSVTIRDLNRTVHTYNSISGLRTQS
ncbi:MAG: phage tail tape measure protein [Solirubrobacterales bacterium]